MGEKGPELALLSGRSRGAVSFEATLSEPEEEEGSRCLILLPPICQLGESSLVEEWGSLDGCCKFELESRVFEAIFFSAVFSAFPVPTSGWGG